MAKVRTTQPPFTLLVANLREGSDPSRGTAGNPTKLRTGFTMQHRPDVSRGGAPDSRPVNDWMPGVGTRLGGPMTGAFTPATGTATVTDNTFSPAGTLFLGPHTLTSGEDFAVGINTTVTATNLAAAITSLPGFTATSLAAVVTVTSVAVGQEANEIRFEARAWPVGALTLAPTTGFLSGGLPVPGPPTLLT